MTFRGMVPQSTRSATSIPNWSSAIICRVPPIAACRAANSDMARLRTGEPATRGRSDRLAFTDMQRRCGLRGNYRKAALTHNTGTPTAHGGSEADRAGRRKTTLNENIERAA